MTAEPLLMVTAMTIRDHIDNLEKRVKVASKKVVDPKKRLSQAQKVLKEANKEIDYLQAEIHGGTKNMLPKEPT